jgi:prophage regulatory protein
MMYQQNHTGPIILRRRQVERRCGLSRSAIYQKVADGTFPKPIRLSTHSMGWLAHEVDAWIEQRIRASRATHKEVRR